MDSSTGRMVSTANGISPCTMPTSTASRLNNSDALAGDPVSATRNALTAPFLPNKTSQANDLTRKLVQNGSSTIRYNADLVVPLRR